MNCTICETPLIGRQTKFCSVSCKHKSTNNKHQNYVTQQKRGLERRIKLINSLGAFCSECGYNKNYSALEFHHIDKTTKKFGITIRECSNNTMQKLIEESKKCKILCSNCHSEFHNPDFTINPN